MTYLDYLSCADEDAYLGHRLSAGSGRQTILLVRRSAKTCDLKELTGNVSLAIEFLELSSTLLFDQEIW